MKRILTTTLLILSANVFAAPLNFECKFTKEASPSGLRDSPFEMSYILDETAKKAYVTGNAGSNEATYIPNDDGITFVEITDSGNVMVTAIAFKDHEAVHSRNGIIFGKLIPTQYYGKCITK